MKYNQRATLGIGPKILESKMAKAEITVFATDFELGQAASREIFVGIQEAKDLGRIYVLGCPGGRSPRSTYRALSSLVLAAEQSLEHVYLAMMDEYVVLLPNGEYRNVDENSHFSCRRFAFHEIRDVLNQGLPPNLHLPYEQVLVPNAQDPHAYEDELRSLEVDCFLLASGATDGHIAFNGRGTERSSITRVTALAEETRRDNMHTFPQFNSLEEVPKFGVTVGLETIVSVSKKVIMLLQGEHKRAAFQRIGSVMCYDPEWPATIVSECLNPLVFVDFEAAQSI